MRTIYRALTLAVVALSVIQSAALAWFVGGTIAWLEDGGVLSHGVLWSEPPAFVEVYGFGVHWFIGSVLVPIAALVVVGIAVAWRNPLAIVASLAILGLAVAQTLILNGVLAGLAAPALQGGILVAIAAIAAIAPKGAAWAAAHPARVRAVYAHTPLAA